MGFGEAKSLDLRVKDSWWNDPFGKETITVAQTSWPLLSLTGVPECPQPRTFLFVGDAVLSSSISHTTCCSVTQSYPTLSDPIDCSMPGFNVLHYLPEFAQTHVHWINDAIQPSHPLSSPSPPALNLSKHPTPQFKSINSSVLSFLHSPTLTSIHDHWKNHSLD